MTVTSSAGATADSSALLVPAWATKAPVAAPPRPDNPGWWGSTQALYAGILALFAGLVTAVWLLASSGSSARAESNRTRRLIAEYTVNRTGHQAAERTSSTSELVRGALGLTERIAQRRGLEERLALKLDRAAVPLRPNELLLLQFLLGVGVLAVLTLAGGNLLVALVLAAAVAGAGPAIFLSARANRRQTAFVAQLPDALQLLAGSLSAGYSLPQAMDSLASEDMPPISDEVGRALSASRVGQELETALEEVAERMDSRDFAWLVMAIRIQRQVGGNLAEVVRTVSETLRERAMLRRQVRVLSAEGRISAYILVGLPIFIAAYEFLVNRDYLRLLWTDPLGIAAVCMAVLLLIVGSLWMRKMIRIEV